jgi:heme/copper-type cytochrome/quinol oxidase subunit 4
MTNASSSTEAPLPPGRRLRPGTFAGAGKSIGIWAAMLLLAALEVFLTYRHPAMPVLISMLLALAAVQAFLGLMYFMHLRHERALLGWSLIGALIFVVALMNQVWPDALRAFRLRLRY